MWIHSRKERFPNRKHSKVQPQANGPFKIIEKINENAYKIELSSDYGVSTTFNVSNLSPYYDDKQLDSKVSLFQPTKNDKIEPKPNKSYVI